MKGISDLKDQVFSLVDKLKKSDTPLDLEVLDQRLHVLECVVYYWLQRERDRETDDRRRSTRFEDDLAAFQSHMRTVIESRYQGDHARKDSTS